MSFRQNQQTPPSTPGQAQVVQATARKGAVGCGIAWTIFTLCISLPGLLGNGAFGLVGFLFLIPFLAVGGGLIAWGLAPSLRALKIAAPDIQFTSEYVRLGEPFTIRYRQQVKAPLEVDSVRVSFFLRESATYRRGTDTYTEKHEIPVKEYETGPRTYQAGEEIAWEHTFTVPKEGMHTFLSSNNKIEWLVKVHVSIPRWPDVKEEYPLHVLAERYADPADDRPTGWEEAPDV